MSYRGIATKFRFKAEALNAPRQALPPYSRDALEDLLRGLKTDDQPGLGYICPREQGSRQDQQL